MPLIKKLTTSVKQSWYADDAAGKLSNLRTWCMGRDLSIRAQFRLQCKCFKDLARYQARALPEAEAFFGDTNVRITDEGRPHLGAPLGSPAYINQFISDKVKQWTDELKSYLSRTTPCIGQYLEKLDNILQCHLIPNLTSRPPPNKTDRDLFALAVRLGGLGIIIPSQQSDREFKSSIL